MWRLLGEKETREGGGVVTVPSRAGDTSKLLALDMGVTSPSWYGSRLGGDVQGEEDVGDVGGDTTPHTDRDRRRSLLSPSL